MDDSPFDVLGMNWWMVESPLQTAVGRQQLIALMELELPECLPSAYGKFEPASKYDRFSKEDFLQFLDKNLEFSVWRPRRPIVGVYLNLPFPPGPKMTGAHFVGFRMNHLSIRFEKEILDNSKWSAKLSHLWKEISKLIRPAYGDIRNLGPHRWQGQTIGCLAGSKPVGWWWRGIPPTLGKAVVLGTVYQKLWPGFTSAAEMIDGLAFASLPEWQSDDDLAGTIGRPPDDQTMVADPPRPLGALRPQPKFPTGWPFGNPYPN
jgi:hypothetical protein